jgi:thioredoxin 1
MKSITNQSFFHSIIIAAFSAMLLFSCNGNSSSDDKKPVVTDEKETSGKVKPVAESMIVLNSTNFDETIGSGIVLVDFWATWCKPCRMQAPVIEEIQKEMESKIKVGKLDIDKSPDIADRYGVQSIPTMIIFKNGKPAEQFVGITTKEKITEAINKQLK